MKFGYLVGILLVPLAISLLINPDVWLVNKIAITALTITWWGLGINTIIKRRKQKL